MTLFLEHHYPILVGFLVKRTSSRDDARDIAQESITKLLRYAGQPPDVLKHLLFRIASNILIDRVRQDQIQATSTVANVDLVLHEAPSAEPGPEEIAHHEQQLRLARNAILRLPDHCKQIYLLNRVDGMTYSQIAQKYDVSVKAVEKQMSKALSLINRHLAINGVGRETRK